MKWSTTIDMTSRTEDIAVITDGIFIVPGSDFTPGLHWIRLHITKDENSGGDGTKAEVWIEKASN